MKLMMTKKKIAIISVAVLVLLALTSLIIFKLSKTSFYLDDKYYGENKITEIGIDEFNNLIDNKESFVVFVYQPACSTSAEFEEVVTDFLEQNQISIYKIKFSEIYENVNFLKFYPSFIIYKKGKMVDFLEADKDSDLKYYQSVDGFTEWFTKYVKLKENISNNDVISNEENQDNDISNETDNNKDNNNDNNTVNIKLDNIAKEEGKVNIYFFWGDGCPHCEAEKNFLSSIENNYGNLFEVHDFEVWHNEKNEEIMHVFSAAIDDEVTGVPYTIIGEYAIHGFNENKEEQFLNAIVEGAKSNYDVYLDEIA